MKKRFLSLLLAAILIVTALPAAAFAAQTAGLSNFAKTNTYADGKFTDVKADDWFEKNVSAAYELNLMVGKGDDFFDTENNLTVAEAMTIAARLRSIYYTGKAEFEQGEPWYQVYANYCKINGVADPADYDMNKAVTRGEFAEIFAKAFPSDALKKINTVHDNMIPDVKKADKFSAAIYLLYRAGVLVGNDSKGTFAPDTNIKRAEAAAITTRMADSSLREKISLVDPAYDDWYYVPATPTTYTVSFDMQGHGTQVASYTNIASGSKITEPAAPTTAGYTFGGWYKEVGCLNKWNFSTDTVKAATTLYAKWTANTYTVTFNMNGHGEQVASISNLPYNSTITDLPKPAEPADFKFGGWYKEASCTNLWATATDLVTQDITLYAKWTPTSCVAAGTIVTMGNGEQKLIEDLKIGDVIRTFDHETGEVSSAPVCFIWVTKNASGAFTLTFEGDVKVTVIEEHGFYDFEEKQYSFINAQNANEYIGHHFYDADNASWSELKSVEVLNGCVDAYSIITSGHLNHLSNGVLSICDGATKPFANVFEYDDHMKYDADKKEADLKAYGLTSLETVLQYAGFIEQTYYYYNMKYLDVMVGKGIITWEWIEAQSEDFVATGISSNPVYVVE